MKFDHMAYQVSDIDKSIAFYKNKLGFDFIFKKHNPEESEYYAMLEKGNARVELIQYTAAPFVKHEIVRPHCPHFCIEVENLAVAMDSLQKNNVEIIRGPLMIEDEETWLYFADEDNNILEYIQWFRKE